MITDDLTRVVFVYNGKLINMDLSYYTKLDGITIYTNNVLSGVNIIELDAHEKIVTINKDMIGKSNINELIYYKLLEAYYKNMKDTKKNVVIDYTMYRWVGIEKIRDIINNERRKQLEYLLRNNIALNIIDKHKLINELTLV